MSRKIISNIFWIFGTLAVIMFFMPIIISIYFPIISNNTTFATIYFILFLTFVAIGNISGEKSCSPLTKDEIRSEKIDQIIN